MKRTPAMITRLLLLAALAVLAGCGLLDPRTPEAPVVESGTFEQPDTPDQVIENLRASVAELNPYNYRRSFTDDFAFRPSANVQTSQLWAGWGREEEERYFTAMAAAAQAGSGHGLQLIDPVLSPVDERTYHLDAQYVLTVNHLRPGLPMVVQGRLVWAFVRGSDGLWRIREWIDQQVADAPSWSELKAAFTK